MTRNNDSNEPLRAIIVGCGGFADNYLGVYRHLPFVRPVLCHDKDETSAAHRAEILGGIPHTTDFSTVLNTEADIAVVSTPNFLHLEQAGKLIAGGKHVLLQKPLARSPSESLSLRQICRSHPDRKLGVYMSLLDFDLWWELRQVVRANKVFGDLTELNIRLGHTGGMQWNKNQASTWRLSREKTGGGAFLMLGVHYLHLTRWLTGLEVKRVCAQAPNLRCPHIEGEDICVVQGELSSGAVFQITTAWNSHGEHFGLYGTSGSFLYLDNETVRIRTETAWESSHFDHPGGGSWQSYSKVIPPRLDDAANPFNQHARFAMAMRDGLSPDVDVNDGVADMRVVDAVYRSAEAGTWEELQDE